MDWICQYGCVFKLFISEAKTYKYTNMEHVILDTLASIVFVRLDESTIVGLAVIQFCSLLN